MQKIAMITGATAGMGLATARELGKKGYRITLNGIDKEQAKDAVRELEDLGIEVSLHLFDVTKEEEIVRAVAEISKEIDHLDVLVNNAGGLGGRNRFEGMPTEFYRFVLALNLDSAFFVTRECIPLLKKGDHPSIINFASNAAWNGGGPGAGIYGVSKGAIVLLTRAMAKDLAEYGIRVNAVSPGTIDTAFHDNIRKTKPEVFASWKNNILMKRLGQPEEVARVIAFLVSEENSFMTGEIVQINGGQDLL